MADLLERCGGQGAHTPWDWAASPLRVWAPPWDSSHPPENWITTQLFISVFHFASIFWFTKALASGGCAPDAPSSFHNNQLYHTLRRNTWEIIQIENRVYINKFENLTKLNILVFFMNDLTANETQVMCPGYNFELKFQLFRLMLCSWWARHRLKIRTPLDKNMAFPPPLEKCINQPLKGFTNQMEAVIGKFQVELNMVLIRSLAISRQA